MRPKPKAKRKAAATSTWMAWEPHMLSLFRMVDEEWAPPAKIRCSPGRKHTTVTGRFTAPTGQVFTASARLEREGEMVSVVASGLSVTFKSKRPAE